MVEQLFKELSLLEEVEAIALGGSRAGVNYNEKSDYDVYLYVTSPVSEEKEKIFYKNLQLYGNWKQLLGIRRQLCFKQWNRN